MSKVLNKYDDVIENAVDGRSTVRSATNKHVNKREHAMCSLTFIRNE